jgi:chitinase
MTTLSKGVISVTTSGLESWLAAHPITTSTTAVMFNAAKPTTTANNVLLSNPNAFSACPVSCSVSGLNPSSWTVHHTLNRLARCNQTMSLDFNIYNPLNDPQSHVSVHSCTADGTTVTNAPIENDNSFSPNSNKSQVQQVQASLQLAWVTSDVSGSANEITNTIDPIQSYLAQQANNTESIAFSYAGQSIIGIYAGAQIQGQGIPLPILQQFVSEVQTMNGSDSIIVQLCGEGRSSKYSFGIIANMNSDLAYVQNAVKTWKDGQCLTSYSGSTTWHSVTLSTPVLPTSNTTTTIPLTGTNTTALHNRGLYARSNCSTVTVASGDTCASLAAECGISAADFTEYNPSSTLCSTLAAGQHVCCSLGTLPDFAPQPYSNGTCATHLVVAGDSCSELAVTYSLTIDEIESFNTQTGAGWAAAIYRLVRIYVSALGHHLCQLQSQMLSVGLKCLVHLSHHPGQTYQQ